jgi:hypothetical protein
LAYQKDDSNGDNYTRAVFATCTIYVTGLPYQPLKLRRFKGTDKWKGRNNNKVSDEETL